MEEYNVRIVSDVAYEKLIADVYFQEQCIFTLTQEEAGILKIQIHKKKSDEIWDLNLSFFLEMINEAKLLLNN